MSNKKILVLPGDGIGNEVMSEVLNLIDWMTKYKSFSFDISERLVGGIAYDKEGDSISDTTMDEAFNADAILFGAVGGPQWDNVEREKRPEAALLRLRKDLDLYANLRPAVVFDALAESSPLKLNLVRGLDILILRELTSGVYFGKPRGVSKINDNEEKAVDTQSYTTSEVERITRVAFDLAKKYNIAPSTFANAYVNDRPFVTSNIIGATTIEQLRENIDSIDITLSNEILHEIEDIHLSDPNPCV